MTIVKLRRWEDWIVPNDASGERNVLYWRRVSEEENKLGFGLEGRRQALLMKTRSLQQLGWKVFCVSGIKLHIKERFVLTKKSLSFFLFGVEFQHHIAGALTYCAVFQFNFGRYHCSQYGNHWKQCYEFDFCNVRYNVMITGKSTESRMLSWGQGNANCNSSCDILSYTYKLHIAMLIISLFWLGIPSQPSCFKSDIISVLNVKKKFKEEMKLNKFKSFKRFFFFISNVILAGFV